MDIEKFATQMANGKTLEDLRQRMSQSAKAASASTRTTEEVERELAYWHGVYSAQRRGNTVSFAPLSYAQEMDYENARKSVWNLVLDRGYEIAAAKNLPFYEVKFDQAQADTVRNLLKWLINDEGSALPLAKGVWLWGEPGTFKTEIMQILSAFGLARGLSKAFHFVDWSLEYDKFLLDGVHFSETHKQFNRCFDEFLKKTEDVKRWGNVTNPNESLIESRYRRFKKFGQKSLFISNFSPAVAQEQLSTQGFDRLTEMVASIKMPGTSKRNG